MTTTGMGSSIFILFAIRKRRKPIHRVRLKDVLYRNIGDGTFTDDQRLLFGIGNNEKIDALTVRWPSGQVTTSKDVAIDRYVTIREDMSLPTRR